MTESKGFRCALIGTGSVLTQCADMLRGRGHEIVGVASPDAKVAQWARQAQVPCAADFAGLYERVGVRPELLFSVVNDEVLGEDALVWPTTLAINYHDGPLPRYAGIHATSWALAAGETEHGVTWHAMTNRVDFGDVLVQAKYAITQEDSAQTLNAKSYEAALKTFGMLVEQLESGTVQRTPQSEADRAFFGRYKRPTDAGIVDWTRSADELARHARSLDFGPYDNKLCCTRVWTGSRFLIASSASLTETGPNSAPGTILSSGGDELRVSTGGTSDLRLLGVREVDGTASDLSDARFACARRLPLLTPDEMQPLIALDQSAHRSESWWVPRLARVAPVQTPYVPSLPAESRASMDNETFEIEIERAPASILRQIAGFVVYLSRIGRNGRFDLPYHSGDQPCMKMMTGQLFETHPPMRVDVDQSASFAEIETQISSELEELKAHPTYARDLVARSPLLRDITELKSAHVWHAAIEAGDTSAGRAAIVLVPSAEGMRLRFLRGLVSNEQAADIAEQFGALLASIERNPEAAASTLNMLTDAERVRVLETFAGPSRDYERGITLVDLIARQVAAHPEATAVVFDDQAVSYAELDAMSNRIAHRLRDEGVGPGSLVGVCLERSVELVAALVGVIKSGGAYVPLDPSYPPERLANMAEDAELEVLLTREREIGLVGAWTRGTVVLVNDESLSQSSSEAIASGATEDDAAYVIFTSGSTGRPKGAANAHVAIINRLMWMQEEYGLEPADRVLQKTPYSFDVSVWEFFWPLVTGATIVVAKPEGHRDSAYLVETIVRHSVTVMHFVPSMLRVFIEDRGVGSCTSLRRVVCSGEALPFDLVERFFSRLRGAKLANLYGPTEAAIDVTAWECTPDDPRGIVPIGRAVPNTFMYVLDEHLSPLPTGVPGEVFIGGVQVGMGYINRPQLTEERFIADPFRAGRRMYKTGDLGRWLADGTLEYMGRLDDQVKIRGFRIELGEIEHLISQQPNVREAVVIVREDVPGNKRIVAYVVGAAAHATIKDALAKLLPEYMVPSAFVTLDELPVTANGKLDRRALPAPARGELTTDRPYVAPTTETEATLAEIWAEILALPRVSVEDNFFEIGGDSILALRIVARASDAGIPVAVHDLFRLPTVRSLAASAGDASDLPTTAHTEPFELISEADRAKLDASIVDAYPLSALQSGMVFHSERSIGSYLYQVAMSLHVKARLNMDLLQRAVDRVVARHPMLRTSFDLGSFSEPMQLVHVTAHAPIEYHDITPLSQDAQSELLARWIDEEAEYAFTWSHPPLLKYTVHKRSDDTFQFGITFHDAILDGWSTSNMMTEIFSRYVAMLANEPEADTTPNPITYRDFVSLERSTLGSNASKAFWQDLMGDAPFTQVPRLPGVGRDVAIARNLDLIVPIPAEVNEQVIERAQELGIPVKAFYLAAHTRIMGMIANQPDVVTGLVMNGRLEDPGGDSSLGNHLNTMPYRLHVTGQTWEELAKAAHASELAALPHRRYIGAQLLRDLGRAGQDNLFETGFNYTHFHVYDRLAGRDDIEFLRVDFTDPFHYVLVANFRVDAYDKRLDIVLNYNTKHMTAAQVRQIGRYYIAAMRAIAEDPHQAASAECILPKSEQRRILEEFAGPQRPYDLTRTLDELIADQAAATPDATALIFEDRALTYRELDAMANRLANRLVSIGSGPGVLVGVSLERCPAMVAALLAVMKSGAAYVPLEPSYPDERLLNMAADVAVNLIIAHDSAHAVFNDITVLRVDDPALMSESTEAPLSSASPHDAAYAIFTSGSTGKPKAALNSHRAIVNRLNWMQDRYELTASDRVFQKTPFSFDVSVWEFFWPLMTGAAIVLAKPQGHGDPVYLAQTIREHSVSVMHFVPSMLRAFVEEPTLVECVSLRRVICSGEALPLDLVDRFLSQMPAVQLTNLYGPTEAAIDVTAHECEAHDARGIVPIGRAVPNTQIHILDEEGNLAPINSAGELFIAGTQVGLGYMNRPELTAQRFVPDPHAYGARMYRTGDLARYLDDGSIEYLGRLDDQVKIRGFRIELGEIQHQLSTQPGVQSAVVIAREDIVGSPRLVAYLVGDADHDTLRGALARVLPEYMVPTAFVTLDALPVTSNGKLDRKALPAPARPERASSNDGVESSTGVEALLAQIWSEVLRLPGVSIHENFFEIGGDSILSIQICARARQHGVLIAPNQLFDHPTIAELAPHARQTAAATAEQGPVTGEAPLIPIQKWLLDQDLAEPDHWNAAIMLEVPPNIDDLSFRQALHEVVNHHDALRLRFTQSPDGWVQSFAPIDSATMAFSTALVDSFEAVDAGDTIERLGASLQTSLHLKDGPVFGAILIRERSAGRARLLMVAHHLVLDGFSWRLIIEDLISASHAHASGGSASESFGSKSNSVRDWALALERHAARLAADPGERDWWEAAMEAPDQVPQDFDAVTSIEADAFVHTESLDDAATYALLHVTPGLYRAQMNDLLIAALGMTLGAWTGNASHRIDMMGHGRESLPDDLDVSRTVGWLTTLFPMVLPLDEMSDGASAVRAAREHLARLPGRGLGFGLLRSWDETELGASLRQAAPAAISFNYLGQFDQSLDEGWSLRIARTRCGPSRGQSNTRVASIEIDAMIVGGQLRIDWTASRTLHRPETIAHLSSEMMTALRTIIDGSEQSSAEPDASAFPLAGLDSEGLARLSALFDSGEWTDD